MAVKIKLKRVGKIRNPQYRIIVADARTKRDGRAIEEIGIYQPREEPSLIRVDSDRAQYWLSVGAQPTSAVAAILRVTGDLQRFQGDPEAKGTLRVAGPRPDRLATFAAAAAESAKEAPAGDRRPGPRSKLTAAAASPSDADAEKGSADAPVVETVPTAD